SKTSTGVALATSMDSAQLSALGAAAASISADGITGTLAIYVPASNLDALLGKTAVAATVNVNAASFTDADKGILSTNIAKVDSITSLALASSEDATEIGNLLSKVAAASATVNASSMTDAQLTALDSSIAKVLSISSLSLTNAQSLGEITRLLGKATGALVDATSMNADKLKVLAAGASNIAASGITGVMALSSLETDAELTALLAKYSGSTATADISGMNSAQYGAITANRSAFSSVTGGYNYYPDNDIDGFGSAAATPVYAPTAVLSGLSHATENHTDCNDASATVYPGAVEICSTNTVDNDCDGNASEIDDNASDKVLYGTNVDGDGASLATGALFCPGTSNPGFLYPVSATVDCNDNDATVMIPLPYFVDVDLDGFGSTTATTKCSSVITPGFSLSSTDCNDADATVNAPQPYFVDGDHDGVGSTTATTKCSSVITVGFSLSSTDCNDADSTVSAPQPYFTDGDHDGVGAAPTTNCSSVVVVGFSATGTDCNDNDATVTAPQPYFVDGDHDGVGSTTATTKCSSVITVGFSLSSTDCNDADATVSVPQAYFVDADLDGVGSTTATTKCSSVITAGFSLSSTDCNDADATVNAPQPYFVDADLDGFGSTTATTKCSSVITPGFSLSNTDCNDAVASSNPGAAETCNG
ncbi:MAG: hypothetical protein EBY29_13285, partial [Planctomycetes bacterium]|nr:hypothetical protein [Planctomycetota bacterium]